MFPRTTVECPSLFLGTVQSSRFRRSFPPKKKKFKGLGRKVQGRTKTIKGLIYKLQFTNSLFKASENKFGSFLQPSPWLTYNTTSLAEDGVG